MLSFCLIFYKVGMQVGMQRNVFIWALGLQHLSVRRGEDGKGFPLTRN